MIEERFSVRLRSECDGVVYSFFDGDKPLDVEMIVDLLNEQQATITALKKDLKTVIDSYDCERIGYCHKGEYCKKWSLNNDR